MSGSDDRGPWEHLLFAKVTAGALLGVSLARIEQLIDDGVLQTRTVGRRPMITRVSLVAAYRDRYQTDPPGLCAPPDPGGAPDPGRPASRPRLAAVVAQMAGTTARVGSIEGRFSTLEDRFAILERRFNTFAEGVSGMARGQDHLITLVQRIATAQGIDLT